MTSEEHLRISDILAYREKRLSTEDHTMAARHLIQCVECRDRIPKPTADEFWNCLTGTGEEAIESPMRIPVWMAIKESITGTMLGRPGVRNGVFASLLGFAILGFLLFVLLPGGTFENENLVAAVDDSGPHDATHTANFDLAVKDEVINTGTSPASPPLLPSLGSNSGSEKKDTARSDPAHNRKKSGRTNERRISVPGDRKQVETRGRMSCGGQRSVALEAKNTDEGLLLSWEKIRGTVLYNVYLSDLDERLIDHYEAGDKTSYLVTAELDAETIYRVRLIVTLNHDERIVSESMNFTVNDLKKGSGSLGKIGIRKKAAASVRCVEAKQ